MTEQSCIYNPISEEIAMSERPSKDSWDKFKITAEIIFAVAGLGGAGLGWWWVHYHERRASERQAQAAIETVESQLRVSRGQLAASLIPDLVRGNEAERQTALLVLACVDPDTARKISQVLESTARTVTERDAAQNVVQQVGQLGAQTKADQDLLQHLERARVLQRFQLYGEADREYISASAFLSPRDKVDSAMIARAKSLYADSSFEEAARTFEDGFRGSMTQ
jgi:hypothetical protein